MNNNKKLFLLINSLSNSEKELVEKQLKSHPKKLYWDVFEKGIDDSTKTVSHLEKSFKGKISNSQLLKYCGEIYGLIINELENVNALYSNKLPVQNLLSEYNSIRNRNGLTELSHHLRKNLIELNQDSGNSIANFNLICHQLKSNFSHNYSPKHQRKRIKELGAVVELLNLKYRIEGLKMKFFEVKTRNFYPSKESEDYNLFLDMLNDPAFDSIDLLKEPEAIYNLIDLKGMILNSIGEDERCDRCFNEGINRFLTIVPKGTESWNYIHKLYISWLVTLNASRNTERRIQIKKEMRSTFETNKDVIHPIVYHTAMNDLLKEEILDRIKQQEWEKGLSLIKENWKGIQNEASHKYIKATIVSYKGMMNFGLGRFDEAISAFNEALQEWQKFFVFDFVVWIRMLIVLCQLEMNEFATANSGIDALRKYMSYRESETTSKESVLKFLKVLRRWINNRGSGLHHEILEKYYESCNGIPPHPIRFDYYWAGSKVENKTMMEISRNYYQSIR